VLFVPLWFFKTLILPIPQGLEKMNKNRISLYDRLPEIYKIKDEEQLPPGQLKKYLAVVEAAFSAIHENIEALYHDFFIETCDDWVIPYIGDLLGSSHLQGEAWTRRADVADTIKLRRSKGTLGAIQLLTYDLTRWGVHCVELRENLLWHQHLNHQRPDIGGEPPYKTSTLRTVVRGGTVNLRDPAMLSLLNKPFDPFAHTPDLKPPALGNIRYNIPNLAIFLWRLIPYRIDVSKPVFRGFNPGGAGDAKFIVRFDVHPLGQPVRLFNINHFDPDKTPPILSSIDETPSPIPTLRLTKATIEKYVFVDIYNDTTADISGIDISETCLQLHLPQTQFAATGWTFRGENLCAWEDGLRPLQNREVAIDPVIGRIAIAVNSEPEAIALQNHLLLTYTYGALGAVGAHPISRSAAPKMWNEEIVERKEVRFSTEENTLQKVLQEVVNSSAPVVIEIMDSMVYDLDISIITGVITEDGGANLALNNSLIIRAASDRRPIIRLVHPLRFRPKKVIGENPKEQEDLHGVISHLTVKLEGLYITRCETWNDNEPLIARVALHRLEIINCTLDPGGSKKNDGSKEGTRTENLPAMKLREPYGFSDQEEQVFKETPENSIYRSITGSLHIDTGYQLSLSDSIIDAGKGVAVSGGTGDDPTKTWGPATIVNNITVFGRMRVESISGRGGIWVDTLEVLDRQKGCIKLSYFSGTGDILPQNLGCVKGTEAKLQFVSEIFGEAAYGQLADNTDIRIRESGPNNDAMGAFGFLLEAHKWRNLQIRYREFMPIGIRPILIPVN
jgi:hypothetical protein